MLRALQEKHPAAGKWLWEIGAELERIDELENEGTGDGGLMQAA
jgi:hypothetical protein